MSMKPEKAKHLRSRPAAKSAIKNGEPVQREMAEISSRPTPRGSLRQVVISQISEDALPNVPAVRATPSALTKLTKRGFSLDELYALVVPKRTFARRQARRELLSIEETDRALRLERIAALASEVFGDTDKAQRWLRKPKQQLDGETPLAFLASEAGARSVEQMLYRIEHGILA
jgi:putative toxin-antitoxin system antitoxin component (TIGR02293 family)